MSVNWQTHNVRLVSITQELGDDPAQVMMRQVIALFDEYPSRENGKHVLRAMKENARQGLYNGSRLPLGYTLSEVDKRGHRTKKKLVIIPVEAETVRLIYRLYLEGDGVKGPMGVKEVTKALNARGLRTRLGARFGVASVHKILTNPVYAGSWRFNQREAKTGRSKPANEIIEVAVPAIIELPVFDRAQASLKARDPRTLPPRVVTGPILLHGPCALRDVRRGDDVAHRHLEIRQGASLLFVLDGRPGRQNGLQRPLHRHGPTRRAGDDPSRRPAVWPKPFGGPSDFAV